MNQNSQIDNLAVVSQGIKDMNREEREAINRNQVKTIDSLISGAISSIDNLILKTEGPNA